jgi:hypothetical protein
MKTYFVASALLCAAVLSSCPSCSSKSDNDAANTEQSLPSAQELKPRIMKAFKALPDHGVFRVNTKSCMTPEFYRTAREAFEIPGNMPDSIGDEKQIMSWFTADGILDSDRITAISIDKISESIVDASVWYSNAGEVKEHRMRLINDNGTWLIAEFDGIHSLLKKYIDDRRAEYAGQGPRELLQRLNIPAHSPVGEKFLHDVAVYKHKYGVK